MTPRVLTLFALLGGCACGPLIHTADAPLADAPMSDDVPPESTTDAGPDAPDAGPPRFPPLPLCALQPGQSYLPGAGSLEGTIATLPAPVQTAAFGGDVAAFLHPGPWRVSEARADRTSLEHRAFEPTDTEPFRSDISMDVAGDGTIWLTRADWRSLDDHGRSLQLIGRQIISIYCGVRTVELDLDESELEPDVLALNDGIPIATPDGATLIDLPGRGVWRFFAGVGEPFLGAGESIGTLFGVAGRLLIEAQPDAGRPYLVEYEGAPVSVEDALLEDVVHYVSRLEESPMFCGRTRRGPSYSHRRPQLTSGSRSRAGVPMPAGSTKTERGGSCGTRPRLARATTVGTRAPFHSSASRSPRHCPTRRWSPSRTAASSSTTDPTRCRATECATRTSRARPSSARSNYVRSPRRS